MEQKLNPNKNISEKDIDAFILDVNVAGMAIFRAEDLILQMRDFHLQNHYYKELMVTKEYYLYMADILRTMIQTYFKKLDDDGINVVPLKYRKILKQLQDPFFSLPK